MCKMSTSNEQLCAGQPDEFVLYLNYTRALQFSDQPNYSYLRGLFKDLMVRKGWLHDNKYDWAGRTVAAMAGLDVPAVPRPLLTTEMSQLAATPSQIDVKQQQRQQTHSNHQSSPASAAAPQQPLSASPPLSLSQPRTFYATDTSQPSPRDSSPRQLSPFYAAQQQQHQQYPPQQQLHHHQQQQFHQQRLHHSTHHQSVASLHSNGGVDPGRMLSQYELAPQSSTQYQLSALPASSSPLPAPLLHHVPPLSFAHPSSSLSSMNPGGGFKSLPFAFPPLLLSPHSSAQPFGGLPFTPSSLSHPSSPYGLSPLSPSTFAAHPFFSPSVSPSSTTNATMGDSSSRLSSATALSSSNSAHTLHHYHHHHQQQQHSANQHGLSPSSYSHYSQTHSRSSLSSPLASPHFSSSSASPYLTSHSSNLSLTTSPLHATNHSHTHIHSPPTGRMQPLTQPLGHTHCG